MGGHGTKNETLTPSRIILQLNGETNLRSNHTTENCNLQYSQHFITSNSINNQSICRTLVTFNLKHRTLQGLESLWTTLWNFSWYLQQHVSCINIWHVVVQHRRRRCEWLASYRENWIRAGLSDAVCFVLVAAAKGDTSEARLSLPKTENRWISHRRPNFFQNSQENHSQNYSLTDSCTKTQTPNINSLKISSQIAQCPCYEPSISNPT